MKINVIPNPKELVGTVTSNSYQSSLYPTQLTCNENTWEIAAEAFQGYVRKVHGIDLVEGKKGIELIKDDGLQSGSYKIKCDKNVKLYASDVTGIQSGFSTILQIMEKSGTEMLIPDVTISDNAEGTYRGLMVDLARNWHPYEFLFDYVDLCYLYKINRLQFHFTDDQSYTLPSDSFPKLPTEDRHYTKEQISKLVDYANARGVIIVPEIEVPGHCAQFLSKYPEIFGKNGIICAEEKAFEALDKIFGELCEMFPYSPYIHIGGDEASISNWRSCSGCKKYMSDNNIKLIEDLYIDFVDRVTKIIFKYGRTPIVWEGFSKKGNDKIAKDVIIIGWESYYQNPKDLLASGFRVINASWKPLYIVAPSTSWTPAEILDWSIYGWQHWWEKSMAYPDGIQVEPTDKVLGGQICVWGDVLAKYDSSEEAAADELVLIRERIPALAEKTWNINSTRNKDNFMNSYIKINALYEKMKAD